MQRCRIKLMSHQDGITNLCSFADTASNADDTMINFISFNDRALADIRSVDASIDNKRAGKIIRTCVDRICFVIRLQTVVLG